jgi:hypothetical protein
VAHHVARAAGVREPRVVLPLPVARLVAAAGPAWEWVSHRRALLTPYAVHQLSVPFCVSSQKARAELGFGTRPLPQSFADAWAWLSTHPASPLQRKLHLGPARAMGKVSAPRAAP